jgi:hypothetical protein
MGAVEEAQEQQLPQAFEGYTFTDEDKRILAMTDDEYEKLTWERIADIICKESTLTTILSCTNQINSSVSLSFHPARNSLDELTRLPSELRRYLAWSASIVATHGSVTAYLLSERLPATFLSHRPPTCATPLAHPDDWRVLRNDWPYGTAPGIVHLVVWLRTPLPTTDEMGELTEEGTILVQGFVEKVFVSEVGEGNVLWFKNWTRSQSVRALEHFHVFVRDVPPVGVMERWVREDRM